MGNVTERVAIAEAMTARLGHRQGSRTDLKTSGNISPSDDGRTRDIAAAKPGLGSGKTLEAGVSPIWGMLGRNSRGFALGFLWSETPLFHTFFILERKKDLALLLSP